MSFFVYAIPFLFVISYISLLHILLTFLILPDLCLISLNFFALVGIILIIEKPFCIYPILEGADAAVTAHDASGPLRPRKEGSSPADRVLSLLDLMAEGGTPLSITEISTRLGVARGTAYSMVHALVERRYLCQLEDKRYFLSYQSFVLGQAFRLQFLDLLLCSEPTLVEFIASGAGAPWLRLADIFVLQPNHMIFSILAKYSNNTSRITTASAALSRRILPWWSNAAGLALTAFSPPPVRAKLLDALDQARSEDGRLPQRAALESQFPTIREEAFAVDRSDPFHLNEVSLACPIFNAAGDACAAAAFTCRHSDYQHRSAEIASALSGLAREISLSMGSRRYYY